MGGAGALSYTSSTAITIQQEKGGKYKKGQSGGGMKLSNPEDRKIMSGQILNQIINYSNGLTNQFFISGGQVTNNIISIPNITQQPSSIQAQQSNIAHLKSESVEKADSTV